MTEINSSNQQKTQPNLNTLSEELVKKYGLFEDTETMYQKGENGLLSNEGIINFAAQDLIDKKITEEEMINSFQKSFNLPKTTIQKIIADVKKDIIPCLKREETELLEADAAAKAKEKEELQQIQTAQVVKKVVAEKNKIPVKPTQTTQPTQTTRGKDTYREPIE